MITCKRCDFEVDETMRHSLIKNCCPSCGSALFGDLHMQRLKLLKGRILEQSFSQELNEDLIFDITLFMLTEFFPARLKDAVPDDVEDSKETDVLDDDNSFAEEGLEDLEAFAAIATKDLEEDYDSIRSEIRDEMYKKIEVNTEDADLDLKLARLKRIAKEKAISGTGPSVRRVTE